jgi:hypothetical protein
VLTGPLRTACSNLPPGVCCDSTTLFSDTRDSNSNNWCHQRRSVIGLSLMCAILLFFAILAATGACCSMRNLVVMVLLVFLAGK